MVARMNALRFATVFFVSSLALHANAQTDFERQEAQARFDEGNKLYAAGRYEEARVKFTQAWATLKRPNVLFNLARAEQLAGKPIDAARHYRRHAHMNDPKITAAQRQETADHLAEIDAKVGRLAITAPAGASIAVDGEHVEDDAASDPIEVSVGHHTITASVGTNKREADATATAGAVTPVSIAFDEPAARATPPPTTTTSSDHVVEPPPVTTERSYWDTPRWIGVAAFGAGLAAIGLGAAFGSASSSHADHAGDIEKQLAPNGCSASPAPPACADLSDARSAQNRDATLEKVFVIGGVTAAVVGAALFFWPRGSATVTPSAAGRNGAGLTLSGTF